MNLDSCYRELFEDDKTSCMTGFSSPVCARDMRCNFWAAKCSTSIVGSHWAFDVAHRCTMQQGSVHRDALGYFVVRMPLTERETVAKFLRAGGVTWPHPRCYPMKAENEETKSAAPESALGCRGMNVDIKLSQLWYTHHGVSISESIYTARPVRCPGASSHLLLFIQTPVQTVRAGSATLEATDLHDVQFTKDL